MSRRYVQCPNFATFRGLLLRGRLSVGKEEKTVSICIFFLSLSLNMPIAEKPLLNSRISLDLPQGVDPTKTIPAFGDRAIPRVVSEPSHPHPVSLSRTVEPLCQPYGCVPIPTSRAVLSSYGLA